MECSQRTLRSMPSLLHMGAINNRAAQVVVHGRQRRREEAAQVAVNNRPKWPCRSGPSGRERSTQVVVSNRPKWPWTGGMQT